VRRYLRILTRRAAAVPFAAAVVARLPIAMGPLGMVVLIQHVRGGYAVAGVVTAAFGIGATVGTPGWGGLLDRRGHPQVIGSTSVLSAACLAALAVAAVQGAPDAVLIAAAVGAGLTFPPISPSMRGAWRVVLPGEEDRRAAYALDAVAVETIFVVGPLLLSLLLLVTPPVVPLLVTAALLAAGGVGYASTGAARAVRPEPRRPGDDDRGRSPLRDGGVLRALTVAAGLAIGFGLNDVSITATARESLGGQARLGLLFAAVAGGSAVGGLWYGSRARPGPEHQRLPVAVGGFAAGLTGTGLLLLAGRHAAPSVLLPLLMVVLFAAGLCIAPALIMLGNITDHHGAADRLGEAQAWLNTAFTAGGALGTALAGAAIAAAGPAAGFLAGGGAVLLTAAVSVEGTRRWALSPR